MSFNPTPYNFALLNQMPPQAFMPGMMPQQPSPYGMPMPQGQASPYAMMAPQTAQQLQQIQGNYPNNSTPFGQTQLPNASLPGGDLSALASNPQLMMAIAKLGAGQQGQMAPAAPPPQINRGTPFNPTLLR
jgi:hypothetical protein